MVSLSHSTVLSATLNRGTVPASTHALLLQHMENGLPAATIQLTEDIDLRILIRSLLI